MKEEFLIRQALKHILIYMQDEKYLIYYFYIFYQKYTHRIQDDKVKL